MTNQTRMIVVGVLAPLIIAAAGIIAILVSIPTLPSPIATHWGFSGVPDGFGNAAVGLVMIALVVVAYSAFAFVVARSSHETSTVNQRVILSIGPFLATILTVIMAGSTVMQAGLRDARLAPNIAPVVALGFALGIALAVLAWFLLPKSIPVPAVDAATLPKIELGATERVAWMQRVEPSRQVGAIVAILLALVLGGGGVVLAVAAPLPLFLIWLVGMLLIGALTVSALFWRVTIDGKGLRARSVIGFPRFVIPPSEVATAAAITVHPTRDFGGWGIRWGGTRRIGVVTRAGEALEVTRKDGRSLVVTASQAQTGAALLNALAARA